MCDEFSHMAKEYAQCVFRLISISIVRGDSQSYRGVTRGA